jgi:alkylation response protein AidB-like acyl-CoA dehydrogenase
LFAAHIWDDAEQTPPARKLIAALGAAKLLAPTFASAKENHVTALWHSVALHEELAKVASSPGAVVLTHTEVGTPLLAAAPTTKALARESVSGRRMAALAVTEPGGGLDFDAMSTTVRQTGHQVVVTGEKWFSSNSPFANDILVLARDESFPTTAASRHTLLRVPASVAGVTVSPLSTMGHRGLTGRITLDRVLLDDTSIMGGPAFGLLMLMRHWVHERLMLAIRVTALARCTLQTMLGSGVQPDAGNAMPREQKRVRLALADLEAEVEQERAASYHGVRLLGTGDCAPGYAAGCKYRTTQLLQRVAERVLELAGGHQRRVEKIALRVLRDAVGLALAGGSDEALLMQIGRAMR